MMDLERVAVYGHLVRFSHTVFALPFAVMGAVLAAGGAPGLWSSVWILLAMVSARTAAMAMNRLADAGLDAENPRTAGREIPAGRVRRGEVRVLLLASAAVFVLSCALLNPLVLALSPLALAVLLSYPFAKRFTPLCHVWLGIGLGLSPVGAWVAVRGEFGPGSGAVLLLGAAVVLWVAGFDVIYALLDVEFDRRKGLFSLPAALGPGPALVVSALVHLGTVVLLFLAGRAAGLGAVYEAGVGGTALLLLYEHAIVRPSDLRRVNTAFFTLNGVVSLLLMGALVLSVALGGPA